MLRILHDTKYDFIKWWRVAVGSTVVFIAAGLIFLGIHGLNRSIEFTGGTLMQVEFKQPPDAGQLRQIVDAAGYPGSEIQPFGSPREFTIRAAGHDVSSSVEKTARDIEAGLHGKFGPTEPKVVRTPAVLTRSLTANGTPCSGPSASPLTAAASAVRAAARASSAQTVMKALTLAWPASMRSRKRSTSSTGDTSRRATISANSTAEVKARSSVMACLSFAVR